MTEKRIEYVKWFSELSNKSVSVAGGKGASLAEMYNLKMPIPPGFIVSAQAYAYFIKSSGIGEKIRKILSDLNVNNTESLNKASKEIRTLIESSEIPKDMQDEIIESYELLDDKNGGGTDATNLLKKSKDGSFVAVRSSATTEDLADASFAGQQDSFLNVKGDTELIEKVKKCISSLFTARAIYYREKKGFDHGKAYLAVVVQKMINGEKSGVMFSKNPVSKKDDIVIEAVFGLGEGIVSGMIKPDHYVVDEDLENFKIIESKIADKKIAIVKNAGKNETIKLGEEKSKSRVLNNYEIKTLAQYAKKLEEHYKKAQDIEFSIEGKDIYIVQSRPITTSFKERESYVSGTVLLSGLGASPGVSSGSIKIVKDVDELEKVEKGDILVAEMTNPDMVVAMQRAAGIITDEGGVTSHAAIVSREMGIPAVVGTGDATKKLKDRQVVTVDGGSGKVFEGKGKTELVDVNPIVPTKTQIKVIVDLPAVAERAAKSMAKGVGLVRLEGIIAEGGKHPIKFVNDGKVEDYIELISKGLKKISNWFEEVWVRTSDIRSDEYRELEGAPQEIEGNPMLGDHGIRFSLKHPEILKAEMMAAKEVADEFPNKKIGLMAPQIISVSELQKMKEIAQKIGMPSNIKIGIMIETPAAVQIIDKLCDEGINFISFGTNDLTQYTLAIDRNNEEVQEIFDETHPAVINSIKHVIQECKKKGVQTSICGQAGSRPEMVKILIAEGIDSISVNADAAQKISRLVSEIESSSAIPIENKDSAGMPEGKEIEKDESALPKEEVPMTHGESGILNDDDIEDIMLRALDNDYTPGNGENEKEDVPALNDAIPIVSGILENGQKEKDEVLDLNEKDEGGIEEKSEDEPDDEDKDDEIPEHWQRNDVHGEIYKDDTEDWLENENNDKEKKDVELVEEWTGEEKGKV